VDVQDLLQSLSSVKKVFVHAFLSFPQKISRRLKAKMEGQEAAKYLKNKEVLI
jgi:hypothetical protein